MSPSVQDEVQEVAPRTFYSACSNLMIQAGKPTRKQIDGELRTIHPTIIEFSRMGKENFGMYITTDPAIIEFLGKRAQSVGDVFGPEEYSRRTIPAERQIAMAKAETARLVESNNRLLIELEAQKQRNQGGKPLQPPTQSAQK